MKSRISCVFLALSLLSAIAYASQPPPCNKYLVNPEPILAKAQAINESGKSAGIFSEIGAGMETSRNFFRSLTGASKTVLKATSEYDKPASDAAFGKTKRYVARDRLVDQIRVGWEDMQKVSASARPEQRFFSYANTVTTKSGGKGQGWVGLRFQTEVGGATSEVHVHVNLRNAEVIGQHDALGAFGVNLIDGCLDHTGDPAIFIAKLREHLGETIEVDAIDFSGPAFEKYEAHVVGQHLLETGLAKQVMFDPKGNIIPPYEALWGQSIVALPNEIDGMLAGIQAQFKAVVADLKTHEDDAKQRERMDPEKIVLIEFVGFAELQSGGVFDSVKFRALARQPQYTLVAADGSYTGVAQFLSTINSPVQAVAVPVADDIDLVLSPSVFAKYPDRIIHILPY